MENVCYWRIVTEPFNSNKSNITRFTLKMVFLNGDSEMFCDTRHLLSGEQRVTNNIS
ncbi:hypothetical protein YC2023_041295 [Brassica napus]